MIKKLFTKWIRASKDKDENRSLQPTLAFNLWLKSPVFIFIFEAITSTDMSEVDEALLSPL